LVGGEKKDKDKDKRVKGAKRVFRTAQIAEDYVNHVGKMMYPSVQYAQYGYEGENSRFAMERPTTLGLMRCPLRQPSVVEMWSPHQIALFEGAIALYGKHFHTIQRMVKTKTTKEVVEFYYIWKKTSHYDMWKSVYESDPRGGVGHAGQSRYGVFDNEEDLEPLEEAEDAEKEEEEEPPLSEEEPEPKVEEEEDRGPLFGP